MIIFYFWFISTNFVANNKPLIFGIRKSVINNEYFFGLALISEYANNGSVRPNIIATHFYGLTGASISYRYSK